MALNPNPSKRSQAAAGSAAGSDASTSASTSPPWLARALELGILVLGVALVMLVRLAWLETAIVTSGSMEPTLRVGDRILVDHRASLGGSWARGDVVLFDAPSGWSGAGETLAKRVVALPGDTVEMRAGALVLNGTPASEPYLPQVAPPSDAEPQMLNSPTRKLGPGKYWVLGDNRWNSDDSRSNGPLPSESIRGHLLRVLLPLSHAGPLSG